MTRVFRTFDARVAVPDLAEFSHAERWDPGRVRCVRDEPPASPGRPGPHPAAIETGFEVRPRPRRLPPRKPFAAGDGADLWATGPQQLQLPLEATGLSERIQATGHLKLTPDYDVFAWLCERWQTRPTDSGWMRPTLYELGSSLSAKRHPARTTTTPERRSTASLGCR